MRITQNNFYNRFVADQQNIKEQLNRLSQQISSGMKIKYGFEDPQVFTDTLRLDYEEHTLTQAVEVATDAQNFANNTDSVMFQFTDALTRFKTLLIQAANDSNADSNYYAISNELKSLKEHFVNLGNSSINGRYLFSGNKLDVKPLDENGNYYGNGEELKAVVGAGVEVPYNIPGLDLFFGEDLNVNRAVTTNVALKTTDGEPVTLQTTLEEITGSINGFDFTVQGRKSDGEVFGTTVDLSSSATVQDLLDGIETAYGDGQVEVSLVNGYINVRDKKEGSSLLDFHIYGIERNGGTGSIAFIKYDGVDADVYADNVPFEKIGDNIFRGNMPQLKVDDNSIAMGSTKLQETTKTDLSGGVTLDIQINGSSVTYNVDDTTTYQQLFNEIESQVQTITGNDASVEFDRNGRIIVSSEGLTSFSLDDGNNGALLFNANDALTIDDPKHDFFAAIDEAIAAVEKGLLYPDGDNGALARNPGIENALARIDHVLSHVDKEHTKIGAMSNSLKYAVERSETLKINVQTLRSDILDTDIGEASVKLNQLSLNFQALMASIAKVQNLSLVNYI
ncbi:flagellar hook-associated protein FlgL [Hydrogenimonas sp.]